MNCKKTRKLLDAFMDKEISDQKTMTRINKHIKICKKCRTELISLKNLKRLTGKKKKIKPGKNFMNSTMDKIEETEQIMYRKRDKFWLFIRGGLIPAIMTAGIIIMLMLSINLLKNKKSVSFEKLLFAEMSIKEINNAFKNLNFEKLLSK